MIKCTKVLFEVIQIIRNKYEYLGYFQLQVTVKTSKQLKDKVLLTHVPKDMKGHLECWLIYWLRDRMKKNGYYHLFPVLGM